MPAAKADRPELGIAELPEFLAEFDVDGDGQLSEEERQAAKEARKARIDEIRDRIDTDGDGEISDEEREAAREAMRERIEAKRSERFAAADTDDSGGISAEEFAAIGPVSHLPEDVAARIFDRLDSDDDGSISEEEFLAHLRPRHVRPPVGPRPPRDGEGGDAEPPAPPARPEGGVRPSR
ncbi:MAG: EF-hand domain-containing protein [Verrucomicrobiales bacterium]